MNLMIIVWLVYAFVHIIKMNFVVKKKEYTFSLFLELGKMWKYIKVFTSAD